MVATSTRMPGKYGNSHSKDPHVSFHRFPSDQINETDGYKKAAFLDDEGIITPLHASHTAKTVRLELPKILGQNACNSAKPTV